MCSFTCCRWRINARSMCRKRCRTNLRRTPPSTLQSGRSRGCHRCAHRCPVRMCCWTTRTSSRAMPSCEHWSQTWARCGCSMGHTSGRSRSASRRSGPVPRRCRSARRARTRWTSISPSTWATSRRGIPTRRWSSSPTTRATSPCWSMRRRQHPPRQSSPEQLLLRTSRSRMREPFPDSLAALAASAATSVAPTYLTMQSHLS